MDSNKTTPDYFNFDINQIFNLEKNKDILFPVFQHNQKRKAFYWKCCGMGVDSLNLFPVSKEIYPMFWEGDVSNVEGMSVSIYYLLKNIRLLQKEIKLTYSYRIENNNIKLYVLIPQLNVKKTIIMGSGFTKPKYCYSDNTIEESILNGDEFIKECVAALVISHIYGWGLSQIVSYNSKNIFEKLELDDDHEYGKCLRFQHKFDPYKFQTNTLIYFENQSMGIKGNSLKVGQFHNFFEKYRRELQEEFLKIQNHPK